MTHLAVLEHFKSLFPQFTDYIKLWFQNGKNSIRVRDVNGTDYIFTYNEKHDWRFETRDSYINSMKGADKVKNKKNKGVKKAEGV